MIYIDFINGKANFIGGNPLIRSRLAFCICGILFFFFLLAGCEDNEVREPENNIRAGNQGAFVLNEGLFNQGTASLSYIDTKKDTIYNQVFYKNNGFGLGDVGQSMTIVDSLGFIVVNNSAKIEVMNVNTFRSIHTIRGFISPRYICPVSQKKAYVSDLYEQKIHVIDLENFTITGTINTGVPVERMSLHKNEVFALFWSRYATKNKKNNKVLIIDVDKDSIEDEIEVGIEPNSMVFDKNGQLWVLCSGGFDNDEKPSLYKILPGKRRVLKKYVFPELDQSPNSLTINVSGDTLYYLDKDIYRMPVNRASLPGSHFIRNNGLLFYTLAIDEGNFLYASDAKDYQQRGDVIKYHSSGVKIRSYKAGIIPTCIRFH